MPSCVKIKNYNINFIKKSVIIINLLFYIEINAIKYNSNNSNNNNNNDSNDNIINTTINLIDKIKNNIINNDNHNNNNNITDWNDDIINDINKDLNIKDQYQSSVEIISTEHITQACIDKCPQESFTNTHTNLGCDEDCYNKQYHLGCSLWESAILTSCQMLCNQTDDDLIQLKDVYCTMGCNNALKRYFKWLRNEIKIPPAPALVADTLTATSLSLEWKVPVKLIALTHETYTPNSYLVQWRYEAMDEDWKFCKNQSIDYSNSTIFLDGLKPYTKYRFRVSIPLSPNGEEILVSHQSIIISTLAEGVPTSQPIIVRTVAVDHTRISVSWEPGPFPNGPLLSYSLEIKLLSSEGYYSAFKEISASENVSFYIFDKLQPAKNYSIEISMRNAVGEGPKAKRSIRTLEAPLLYQNEPEPKLILGTEYSVMFQDADILSGNSKVFYHSKYKLLGIAVHIAKSLLFVTDVTKKVIRTTLGAKGPTKIILTADSENVNFVPSLLTIDWLNDHLYMLAKLEHSKSQYQISRCNLDGSGLTVAYAGLSTKPSHIQVDPVNGFLYWIIPGHQIIDSGLYKMDLADISNGVKRSTTVLHLLQGENLGAFVVDFNKFKLLVPALANNNIYSVSYDGNSKEEIRNNTQKPQLSVVKSLAMANGIFYWTNGISLFTEDHHETEDKYYHNSFPIIQNETFISVAVNLPSSQPIPVPVSPPREIQSLLSSTTAKVTWDIPYLLGHQGKGAWQKWEYVLKVMDSTIVHHSFMNISETQYTVYNLKPDTNYTFLAAAYTSSGYSPYSTEFKAKTLKSSEDRYLFWSSNNGLYQTDIIGENATLLKSLSDLSYGSITDIEWFEDLLFFVSNSKLTILNRTANDVINVSYANEVENIGIDWIGRKIYWSSPTESYISRSNFDGQNREYILPMYSVKEIRIDSLNGHIYYSTGNSIEACRLNGKDKIHYTTFQHSTGYIMGLTLDIENEKLYWIGRRYGDNPDLYIANMANAFSNDRRTQQISLGTTLLRQDLPSNFLTHFSDRLLWMQNNSTVIVGDISGENLAKLNLMYENKIIQLKSISVLDPSHRLYPKGISRKKLNVIPETIDPNSIRVDGLWNAFNITWSPVYTVNYGKIFYEIKIQVKPQNDTIEISTPNDTLMPYFYYSAGQIMPYTVLNINIRAYTYWAAPKFTSIDLYSPAAAPSEPSKERIFITHSHNPFTGGRNITATLRWNPPERPNGLIVSYTVFGWYKINETEKYIQYDNIRDESIVIPNLLNNITYYFQIQAFTSVEGGNKTFPIYVNSSIEQPIPRLLVAESNRIEEFDLDLNLTKLIIHTGYPVNLLAYIELEKRIFWFDDNNLVSLKAGDRKQIKLATINNEILSLTVDWIQRIIYWSQIETENGLKSSIYRLDLNQFEGKPILGEKLHSSSNHIRNLTISPFDQKLFWLEFENSNAKYGRLVQYDLQENAEMELEDLIKAKCNRTLVIKTLFFDTPSWKENNLVLINIDDQMYMYGLKSKKCSILTKEKYSFNIKNSVKQIVKDSDNIYIIRNETIIIRSSRYKLKYQVNYNKKISHALAFDYQNYPKMQCLLPKQVTLGTEIPQSIKETEHSLTLKLPLLEPYSDCPLQLTGIKYVIQYSPVIDSNLRNSTKWKTITSYKPISEVKNLKSFTKYILRVSVTNYYAEQLGLKMFQCDDIIISTAPGPPSSPRNLDVEPISPTEAMVSWLKPLEMNSESIWYEIHFETESNKHQSPITDDKFILDSDNLEKISFKLIKLLPSHQYTLWILAYSSNTTYTSSERVEIEMFDEPDNITIKEIGSTFMKLHWITPKDVNKYILECNIKGNRTVMTVFDSNDISFLNIDNEQNYLISDLEPKTTYRFSARLFYSKHEKSYVWPPDDRFYFETLGDCPSQPGKPKIIPVGGEVIKISWDPARDNGAFIEEYSLEALTVKSTNNKRARRSTEETLLLEKTSNDEYEENDNNDDDDNEYTSLITNTDAILFNTTDSDDNYTLISQHSIISSIENPIDQSNIEKWFIYCNVTENHCIKHDSKIKKYTLRVRARNSYGWGPYSIETEAISEPYSSPQRHETLVWAISIPVGFCGVIVLISCIIFVHHRCTTPKKILQQANNRFMDVELANLRELPRGGNFIQQTNILYMPHPLTDADIALLPQICRDQITMSNFLGSGAFGEVYEGIVRSNDNINIRVAVKTLRKGASEQEKFEFLQEAQLMSNFKHEHILRLIGVCFDCESLFIIMELMQGGDLLSYLRSSRAQNGTPSPLSLLDLISICVDVASGCRYLEEMHFVHRDLACRNCLVSSVDPDERVVKIGDFGLARDIYKSDYYRKEGEGLLPVRWMSPESLVDGVFTSQSDIWAFGVLCWEIMTLGQQPYPARNNVEVLHYVKDGGRLEKPTGCPKELYQLMLKCWSYRPANRPTFRYCLQILERLKESTNKSYQLLCNDNSNRLPNGDIFNPSYLGSDFNHNHNNIFEDLEKLPPIDDNCESIENQESSEIITPASSTLTITPKYLEILYDENAIPSDGINSTINQCEPYEIPIPSKELVPLYGTEPTTQSTIIDCPTTYSFTSPKIMKSLTTFCNGNAIFDNTTTTTTNTTTTNGIIQECNNNNNNNKDNNINSKRSISNSSTISVGENSPKFLIKRLSNSSCSNNLINTTTSNNNINNNNNNINCNENNNLGILNTNQILKVNLPSQNNNTKQDNNKINYKKLYKDSIVVNNTAITAKTTINDNNNHSDGVNNLDYSKNSKELQNKDGRILVSS